MTERCVDASVVVKLALAGEPHRGAARRLFRESAARSVILIAPPLLESEVDSVIRRRVYDSRLSARDAGRVHAVLDRAPIQIVTQAGLRRRARAIAERFNQRSVYDSTYAALADLRGCEFWTADRAFHAAVQAALPFVKYLPTYP